MGLMIKVQQTKMVQEDKVFNHYYHLGSMIEVLLRPLHGKMTSESNFFWARPNER
jgi:hypothetical protein